MTEHDPERPEVEVEGEDDVEAHGLKEAAVAGMSAAALIAGAGNAMAATTPEAKAPDAKLATHKGDATFKFFSKDPTLKADATSKLSADPTLKGVTQKGTALNAYKRGASMNKLTDQS